MKSEFLKKALQQAADFNAALVYAKEILEAVEDAEKKMAAVDGELVNKRVQIAELDDQIEAQAGRIAKAKKDYNAEVADLQVQKQPVKDELKKLKAESEAARNEFALDAFQRQADIKALDAQIKAKTEALETLVARHQEFLKTIGA